VMQFVEVVCALSSPYLDKRPSKKKATYYTRIDLPHPPRSSSVFPPPRMGTPSRAAIRKVIALRGRHNASNLVPTLGELQRQSLRHVPRQVAVVQACYRIVELKGDGQISGGRERGCLAARGFARVESRGDAPVLLSILFRQGTDPKDLSMQVDRVVDSHVLSIWTTRTADSGSVVWYWRLTS